MNTHQTRAGRPSRMSSPPRDGHRVPFTAGPVGTRPSHKAPLDGAFKEFFGLADRLSIMLDVDARVIFCNDHLLRLTGWTRDEVLGHDWFDRFLPPPHETLRTVFANLLDDQPDAYVHENEIVTRAGDRRLIRWTNMALRGADGEVIATASVGEDVTKVRKATGNRSRETLEKSVLARGKHRVATPSEVVSIANHLGDGKAGSGLALVRLVAEHCAQLAEECGESMTGAGVARHIRDLFQL